MSNTDIIKIDNIYLYTGDSLWYETVIANTEANTISVISSNAPNVISNTVSNDTVNILTQVVSNTITAITHGISNDTVLITDWLSNNSIQYQQLNYADANQHSAVFTPLNTWIYTTSNVNITEFPFIIYDTVTSEYYREKNIILGANNIVSSNLNIMIKTINSSNT